MWKGRKKMRTCKTCSKHDKWQEDTFCWSKGREIRGKGTWNPSSAVDKDEDHATKGPCNAKNANPTTDFTIFLEVSLVIVPYDCEHSNVEEEQSGNELSNKSPVKGPLCELLSINEWCWWRVLVVLPREGATLSNLNVLRHTTFLPKHALQGTKCVREGKEQRKEKTLMMGKCVWKRVRREGVYMLVQPGAHSGM